MTWRQLKAICNGVDEGILNSEVHAFPFFHGEMIRVDEVRIADLNDELSTHCSDMADFEGMPYLLCDAPDSI